MSDRSGWPDETGARVRLCRRRSPYPRMILGVFIACLGGWAGVFLLAPAEPTRGVGVPVEVADSAPPPTRVVALAPLGPLLAPVLSAGAISHNFEDNPPLSAEWRAAPAPTAAQQLATPILPEPAQQSETPRLVEAAPLPLPRPAELRLPPAPEQPQVAASRMSRRAQAALVVAPAPTDDRNFLEKLFGVRREPGAALAYAAPQDDVVDSGRGRRLSPLTAPTMSSAARTAVYDISARTVYMPNGDKLEAHSGLGDKMDDPRFVHIRMHGATPPHIYDLTEREALFHGHRALRMHPVGGSGAIFGRSGLLTHPYLLGPNGDSNGCVSFKDYEKFLQAYLRGEVKRLVVVARMN